MINLVALGAAEFAGIGADFRYGLPPQGHWLEPSLLLCELSQTTPNTQADVLRGEFAIDSARSNSIIMRTYHCRAK